MSFFSEILEYVARGLFSVHEFEGGFWVLFFRMFFN